jgi:hypothetical protein
MFEKEVGVVCLGCRLLGARDGLHSFGCFYARETFFLWCRHAEFLKHIHALCHDQSRPHSVRDSNVY